MMRPAALTSAAARHVKRRGAALAAAVVILAVINLAVIGAVTARGDDDRISVQRAQTLRAFFAAEAGAGVALTETVAGRTLPAGSVNLSGGASFELTSPGGSPPLTITINGRCAQSSRRLSVNIQ